MSVYNVPENRIPPSEPKPANVGPTDLATNEEARPVPIFGGYGEFALQWLAKAYDIRRQPVEKKVGKDKTKVGENIYCHVFGGVSIAGVEYFRELEVNNEIWWRGSIKATGTTHTFTIPGKCTVTLRWGGSGSTGPNGLGTISDRATQTRNLYFFGRGISIPYDDPEIIPDDIQVDLDYATPGQVHTTYENDFTIELSDFFIGFNASSVPTVKVGVERKPQIWTDDPANVVTYEGINPIFHTAEAIENHVWGLSHPGLIDETTWRAFAPSVRSQTTVNITGIGAYNASLGHQSPQLTRRKKLSTYVNEMLAGFDGFLYWKDGQLVPGLEEYVAPESLPILDLRNMVEPPKTETIYGATNRVTVEIRDRAAGLEKTGVADSRLSAVQRSGRTSHQTLTRANYITRHQGKALANREAAIRSQDQIKGSVKVLSSFLLGEDLGIGQAFRLVWSPQAIDHAVRIQEIDWSPDGRTATLAFSQVRGVTLDDVEPHTVAKPDLEPVAPTPAEDEAIVQLPRSYGQAVIALASRSEANQVGFGLWYSQDGATYDFIGDQHAFALAGTLDTAVDSAASTLEITATGHDLYKLESQSSIAQADDELLAILGSEIYSIGAVTALGSDSYSLAVRPGRMQTTSAAHSAGDTVYVIRKDELEIFKHAAFPAIVETGYFKIQTATYEADLDLADAAELEHTFADHSVTAPANVTVDGLISGYEIAFDVIDDDVVAAELWFADAPDTFNAAADRHVPLEIGEPGRVVIHHFIKGVDSANTTLYFKIRLKDNKTPPNYSSISEVYSSQSNASPTLGQRVTISKWRAWAVYWSGHEYELYAKAEGYIGQVSYQWYKYPPNGGPGSTVSIIPGATESKLTVPIDDVHFGGSSRWTRRYGCIVNGKQWDEVTLQAVGRNGGSRMYILENEVATISVDHNGDAMPGMLGPDGPTVCDTKVLEWNASLWPVAASSASNEYHLELPPGLAFRIDREFYLADASYLTGELTTFDIKFYVGGTLAATYPYQVRRESANSQETRVVIAANGPLEYDPAPASATTVALTIQALRGEFDTLALRELDITFHPDGTITTATISNTGLDLTLAATEIEPGLTILDARHAPTGRSDSILLVNTVPEDPEPPTYPEPEPVLSGNVRTVALVTIQQEKADIISGGNANTGTD